MNTKRPFITSPLEYPRARAQSGGCKICVMRYCVSLSRNSHFADLNNRLYIGVVRQIVPKCRPVRDENFEEALHRVEKKVTHHQVSWLCVGSAAPNATFYRNAFESGVRAEQ